MTNLWLFDRRCTQPEKSTASALALLPRSANDPTARLWRLVKDTCPLPLLEHWQAPVLALLRDQEMLKALPMALGALQGFRLGLDVPLLTDALGELIRSEQRRVGQACVGMCRSRGSTYHSKKKYKKEDRGRTGQL